MVKTSEEKILDLRVSFYKLFFEGKLEAAAKTLDAADEILIEYQTEKEISLHDYARCLRTLAKMYYDAKIFGNAISYYEQAGAILYKNLNNKEDFAICSDDIAEIYFQLKKYNEAIKYSTDALGELLETSSTQTIRINNRIASSNTFLGQHEKALESYYEAFNIVEYICPKDGDYYLKAIENLASATFNVKDYNSALGFLEIAFEIRKKKYGEKHPSVGNPPEK